MDRRFCARLRTARSMLRAPKSAAALPSDEPKEVRPVDATVTGTSAGAAFGSTDEFFIPDTAARSTSAFAVKFCTMRSEPPKSTTAINRSGPALPVRLGSHVGPGGKTGNRLLLVIFENLEIILCEFADVVAFLVRHHRIDEHQF